MKPFKKHLQLYGLTDRQCLSKGTLEEAVRQAIAGGITCLQLREKHLTGLEKKALAIQLKALCRAGGIPFIINDDVPLALSIDADGVHLGLSDMDYATARARLGPDKIIGLSTHSVEEAITAERLGADYIGAGAVFATQSKTDIQPMPHAVLKAICSAVDIPVVAIGGIGLQNLNALEDSGISGVAVISALFGQEDVKKAAMTLRAQLHPLCERISHA